MNEKTAQLIAAGLTAAMAIFAYVDERITVTSLIHVLGSIACVILVTSVLRKWK